MLGPGVDPRSRTRAATPISGGWRGMARTKNSVCEKSPVRNHVVPATVAEDDDEDDRRGDDREDGVPAEHIRDPCAHGSSATIIRATRSLPSAVRRAVGAAHRHRSRRCRCPTTDTASRSRSVDRRCTASGSINVGTVHGRRSVSTPLPPGWATMTTLCPFAARTASVTAVASQPVASENDSTTAAGSSWSTARRDCTRPRRTTTWRPRPIEGCARPRGSDSSPGAASGQGIRR